MLTGYGPANSTMATCDQNVQESSSCCRQWMSHLVFSICQNHEVVGPNASEGIELLRRREKARKEQKLPSSMSLWKAWPRLEVGFPTSRFILKVHRPISKIQIRSASSHFKLSENFSQEHPFILGVLVNSRCSQTDSQE